MKARRLDEEREVSHGPPGGRGAGRRTRVLRLLAFALVPALFVALVGFGLLRSASPRAVVGRSAPEFDLPLLEGGGSLSSADLKGSPVVLNFWASWCIPCREEAPALERAWRTYRDRGVRVVGVNVQDVQDDARAFAGELGITYPLVRDSSLELATRLGVRGLPETFFIDDRWTFAAVGSGERVGRRGSTVVLGAIAPAVLRAEIEALIARMEREGPS